MAKLFEDPDKFYKPKKRPSGHDIGRGFAKDNGGALPSNLISVPNTESNGFYTGCCKLVGINAHPARFPVDIPRHFIRMCTEPGDVVLDIFGGSNTTGQAAEADGRRWLSFEMSQEYVAASAFRFLTKGNAQLEIEELYARLSGGETGIDVGSLAVQPGLLDVA